MTRSVVVETVEAAMNPPPTGDPYPGPPRDAESRPAVELLASVDDRQHPTTMTVYPRHGGDRTTSWLTIGIDWVVELDEMV